AALSEHEKLGVVFAPAKITRVKDGAASRNGVGSVRRLKIGPLPGFEETVTAAEEPTLIEYEITKGGPLKGHWAVQRLTPTGDGGTRLDYRIGFDAPLPGMAKVVGAGLSRQIKAGLTKLVP
ncbi:MAG: SRPBCC family protein, partial [Actinomycetales bacterium]